MNTKIIYLFIYIRAFSEALSKRELVEFPHTRSPLFFTIKNIRIYNKYNKKKAEKNAKQTFFIFLKKKFFYSNKKKKRNKKENKRSLF